MRQPINRFNRLSIIVAAGSLFCSSCKTSTSSVAQQPLSNDVRSDTYRDSIVVALRPPLYYQDGQLHYTLDGTEPTANSPVYQTPFVLHQTTTIKARQFDSTGGGTLFQKTYTINDTTGPTIKSSLGVRSLGSVHLVFSEQLQKESAETTANYKVDPPAIVSSAQLAEDGKSVELKLVHVSGEKLSLTVQNVRDLSPAANVVASDAVSVQMIDPVFQLAHFTSADGNTLDQPAPNLPIHAKDRWSMNFFLKLNHLPEDRTTIAGFGKILEASDGQGRYISHSAETVRFFSRGTGLDGNSPLEVGKWQMLTVTFDGKTLSLFKDGKLLNQNEAGFADDESAVRMNISYRNGPQPATAPARKFDGDVRDFTVWNEALTTSAIESMNLSLPK